MKIYKTLIVMAAAVMLLSGCSGNGSEDTAPVKLSGGDAAAASQDAGNNGGEDQGQDVSDIDAFYFEANDSYVIMNAEADPTIESLGDGYDYFESESCAYQGLDKVYTYNSFIVRTYPKDGVDYISSVELRDDTLATAEGVCIGMTQQEVLDIYGDPDVETSGGYEYQKGDSVLSFIIEDGKVASIMYNAITE